MQRNIKVPPYLEDSQQSWLQLAVIQLSGWTSLPILATSILILQGNSFLGAALTIIVGNAILWFIRFGIVAMSYKKRQSTLDIARDYLGSFGSYFIAGTLILSTLAWFIAQTTIASHALTHLVSINEDPNIDKFTQMSVFLGVVSTFLCMEGIVALRKLAVIVFPFLILAFFIAVFTLPHGFPKESVNSLSLSGLTLVLGTNLGLTSDLPTFFRHSRSWEASVKALTLIQLASIGIGLLSLYFASIINIEFGINESLVLSSGSEALRISLITLVFLSVICANVANVYSASVGWEVMAPKALVGRKEYLILGLGLTTIFIFTSGVFPVDSLLNISDSSLVNLCVVLIAGYIISGILKRPPSFSEKITYFMAWLLSTILNSLQFFNVLLEKASFLSAAIMVIFCVFCFHAILYGSKNMIKKIQMFFR